ncbi:MAG: outer membrane protein assembly factor BamD [Desulfobacterales bacterium]|nr:outer membrane protein assembly factor BamD [Desulfobacterales bacterium]
MGFTTHDIAKNNRSRLLFIALLALVLGLQTGCASMKNLFGFGNDTSSSTLTGGMETPENLAMEGLDLYNHGRYKKALEVFEDLKSRFPFSPASLLAELKSADCNYNLGNYHEALLYYQEFEAQHPTNEAIPYVLFQIGMCHYRRIDGVDRDTSGAVNAVGAFSRLLRAFPDTPYTVEARARLQAARNFLANHEFYVASFYVRTKSYDEAESRLEYLLKHYPDATVAPQAQTLLANLKSGNPPERSWTSWLPSLSLPDWKAFSFLPGSRAGN